MRRDLPFNLGWWALTFPLGVFAAGTNMLSGELKVPWVGIMSLVFFVMLASFWAVVAARTLASLSGPSSAPAVPITADSDRDPAA